MKPIPDEIWHQIFAHFELVLPEDPWWEYWARVDHDLQKTLTSICRVSRQFCRVGQPLLFRTILLRGGHSNKEWNKEWCGPQYTVLGRALTACPELSLDVRKILLYDSWLSITPGFPSMLQDLLPSLDLPDAMRTHMECELERSNNKSNSHKCVNIRLFLLALMPHLRLVDFNYGDYGEFEASIWMMSGREDAHHQLWGPWSLFETADEAIEDPRSDIVRAAGSENLPRANFANFGLPNLEELRLRTYSLMYDPLPFESFEAVLLHPNLKTLRLHRIDWRLDDIDAQRNTMKWPDEPCGVQFLELRESLIDGPGFRHILTRFTGLRTLIIHSGAIPGPFEPTRTAVHLDGFGSALREFGQNLVDMSLDLTSYFQRGMVEGHLGSVREMRSLRYLSVVTEDLAGNLSDQSESILSIADLLPLSIETVQLHCAEEYWEGDGRCCGCISDVVRKLLELGHMPNLRQFSIIPNYTSRQWLTGETLERDFDVPVDGWDMTVETRHSWRTPGVSFTKRE